MRAIRLFEKMASFPGRAILARSLLAGVALAALAGCPSEEAKRATIAAEKARTTGRLVVKTNRADATVEAQRLSNDGVVVAKANGLAAQPLSGLAAGRYDVVVHSDGWTDLHQQVDISAGNTLEIAANFPVGALKIESLPTGATVRHGTQVLGRTPLQVPQLPAGECELAIDYPGWPSLTTKVVIPENGETATTVRLPHGRLVIESDPAGATVMFGRRALGQTPLTIERFQAGPRKLLLQAKEFPPLELDVNVEDQGELKVHPNLAEAYPLLDPVAMLRAVWWEATPNDPNRLSPTFDPFPGFHRQGSFVRNLNRKKLYESWLKRTYRCSGKVKSFDRVSGQLILADEGSDAAKYRLVVTLSPLARITPELVTRLAAKDATFSFYAKLAEMEEFERPGRPIEFHFTEAEPMP